MATITLQRTTLNQEMLNLLIFDDHPGWREGIQALPMVRSCEILCTRIVPPPKMGSYIQVLREINEKYIHLNKAARYANSKNNTI